MSHSGKGRDPGSVDPDHVARKMMMARSLVYVSHGAGLRSMEERAFEKLGPEQKLTLMLSTKFHLTHPLIVADHNPDAGAAVDMIETQTYRVAGQGQCAVLWSRIGTTQVFKAARPGKVDQLFNDFLNHYRVRNAFEKAFMEFKADINVPRLGFWVTPKNERYWKAFLRFYPDGSLPSYGFFLERIVTLPLTLRRAIFEALAPENLQPSKNEFLANKINYPCVVHLHLGRRRVQRPSFTLRNFSLAVDEMESLHLKTKRFATTVGKSLAVLHWVAGIDGNGVEFILGTTGEGMLPTLEEYEDTTAANAGYLAEAEDFGRHSLTIWIIDFDQCQKFGETAAGLKQLQQAFATKDAYYPKRPCGSNNPKDLELWSHFRDGYLTASKALTKSKMPETFMDTVENEF